MKVKEVLRVHFISIPASSLLTEARLEAGRDLLSLPSD